MSFDKLKLGEIKKIIKHYNLHHDVKLSKVENGDRIKHCKEDLIKQLDKHLFVDNHNMIRKRNELLYEMPMKEAKKEHKKLIEVLEKADEKIKDVPTKKKIEEEIKEQKEEMKMMKKETPKKHENLKEILNKFEKEHGIKLKIHKKNI